MYVALAPLMHCRQIDRPTRGDVIRLILVTGVDRPWWHSDVGSQAVYFRPERGHLKMVAAVRFDGDHLQLDVGQPVEHLPLERRLQIV